MFYSVITTIQEPTDCVVGLISKIGVVGGRLVVAGDEKGPASFVCDVEGVWPVDFLSLDDQIASGFQLAAILPTKHYSRKNIAYLFAIRAGASCIYETDDDNAPNERWIPRSEWVDGMHSVACDGSRWINVYRYFSLENVWPRGLPLDEVSRPVPDLSVDRNRRRCPVQQGLVDGSPDVDAIWRLTLDHEFFFDRGESVYLEPGNWCPFNTQSTWWWPLAYPLLYVPSHCSFRMCDIWKSFVAQRCLWAMDLGIVFHEAEVFQVRNFHDLMKDFRDEVPGYTLNRRISEVLDLVELSSSPDSVGANLLKCYSALVSEGIFPPSELQLVSAWLADCAALGF